jgi:hypothetical protein
MEWLALKHPLLVHLPVATALILPLPLLLAQRAGRGIKPWWNTCRYLTWIGVIFLLPTLLSGFAWAKGLDLIPEGKWLAPAAAADDLKALYMQRHQILGLASALLGFATLWSLYRGRLEHEGLGFLALILGCGWAVTTGLTGYYGGRMAHALLPEPPPKVVTAPVLPPVADPEAKAPLRALDYASLTPLHSDPFRSKAHDDLWIRGWISPTGLEAWKAGQPLPAGSYAVLSTQVGRWGRPGPEPGPLYFVEMKADGKPRFALYWGRVPEDRRAEFGGQERLYLREGGPLETCATCHAQGTSSLDNRTATRRR